MSYRRLLIQQLAESILIGNHTERGITNSISGCLNINAQSAAPLAREIVSQFDFQLLDTRALQRLCEWLEQSPEFYSLRQQGKLRIVRWPVQPWQAQQENTSSRITEWQLPNFSDLSQLAHWCQLSPGDLDWFSQRYKTSKLEETKLRHYHYHAIKKSNGDLRILETPKAKLKWIQQKIHKQILTKIPVHPAAHGFVKDRSTLSHCQNHVNKSIVVAMDLQSFFLSISAGRVVRFFQSLGYQASVSKALTGLCLNRTLESEIRKLHCVNTRKLHRLPHLPQGAPSSPGLANLCAYYLDCRLQGAAQSLGFEYSRYADDLAFSHDEPDTHSVKSLLGVVRNVVKQEGFALNNRKTRVMSQAQRQQITGIVVNEKLNINRKALKQLEAVLMNCVRHSPATQNRNNHPNFQQHLLGKLNYFSQVTPERCRKLWMLYDAIDWAVSPALTNDADR